MVSRLSRIDGLTAGDHSYLSLEEDSCYYLGEYTARRGFSYSETNNLISNLKKPMDRAGLADWKYKFRAIQRYGDLLREVLPRLPDGATVVPIPPSRAKGDPMYDDRLLRVLAIYGRGKGLDVRELIVQRTSTEPVHLSAARLRINELTAIYEIDEELADPAPTTVVIFDDVLTTGAHYRAVKQVLEYRFPEIRTVAVFLARRVLDPEE